MGLSEFNKFEALDMEALQNMARDHGDTKAGCFGLAYQSARSKLDLPVEHFRSLVLRCVGDKDHSKIFDIVAKVEKVAKTATLESEKRVAYRGNPQNNYNPQRRSSSIRCYNCNPNQRFSKTMCPVNHLPCLLGRPYLLVSRQERYH